MSIRTKQASEGKVFAFRDEQGKEIILGDLLYLGINDDGSRYYEVDKEHIVEEQEPQVVEEQESVVDDEKEQLKAQIEELQALNNAQQETIEQLQGQINPQQQETIVEPNDDPVEPIEEEIKQETQDNEQTEEINEIVKDNEPNTETNNNVENNEPTNEIIEESENIAENANEELTEGETEENETPENPTEEHLDESYVVEEMLDEYDNQDSADGFEEEIEETPMGE